MYRDYVAEVDIGLPRLQCVGSDPIEADHDLQAGSVPLLQGGKAQFPGIACEYHPSRDGDDLVGRGVDRQVGIGGANLGQSVRASGCDRVRVTAIREQASALVPADLELFGKVCWCILTGGAHDVPA